MVKPMGMQRQDYLQAQERKSEEEFKYSTNQNMQKIHFAMDEFNNRLNKSIAKMESDNKECEIQISQVMESCMDGLKEFRISLNGLEKKFQEVKKQVETIAQKQNELASVSLLNEKISRMSDEVNQFKKENENLKRDLKDQAHKNLCNFVSQLKSMKEEILSIPSEIPELTKRFDKKLEIVELNGQNAVLRSSNNEKQIMLVERKIENLYQLVKRLEIANQGVGY